jgi:hypothetical protein
MHFRKWANLGKNKSRDTCIFAEDSVTRKTHPYITRKIRHRLGQGGFFVVNLGVLGITAQNLRLPRADKLFRQ